MKKFVLLLFIGASASSNAQKIDSIYFHLYTDSLKKGVHNYINVDGLLSNGRYLPLSDKQIDFWCNTGTWDGNDLIIDSTYKKDSVVIKATLKENSSLTKTITVYIKTKTDPDLKTEQQVLEEMKKGKKKN
ncbi:MAG TPA: hypothetical protein PL045_09310 [Chitinophagaceae bacterium]|nr:hypothetical protein [Chitinophagaceae bacterium]